MFITGKPSILIIDDDTAILRTFTRIFQRRGYRVSIAEKGKEAVEKLSHNNYDVALIDLCLSDMEGTELFPIIHKTSPRTLKIMLTGKMLMTNSVEGADAFLEKPIQPEKLFSVIDSKLKEKNMET